MEAKKLYTLALAGIAALSFTSCSKFDRLPASEKFAQVHIGASRAGGLRGPDGGLSTLGTAQTGGVIVWAKKTNDSTSAAVLLATDADHSQPPITLAFGTWDFYAIGFEGGIGHDVFAGTTQCGKTGNFTVDSSTTSVGVTISTAGCHANTFFGNFPTNVKPIRFVTCNYTANPTTGANGCGTSTRGDLQSFEVLAHRYEPTSSGQRVATLTRVGGCVDLANPATDNFITSSLLVPDGEVGSSPMFFTVNGYTATGCGPGGGTKVDYVFRNGLRNGSENHTSRFFTGTSTFSSSNALYLFHGSPPAPTISSVSPSSGGWGGMTEITITGTNFDSTASITVDGVACSPVTFLDSQHIKCTPEATDELGDVDVEVTNPDSQVATDANGYTYVDDGFGYGSDVADVGTDFTISSGFFTTAPNSLGSRTFHSYFNVQSIADTSDGGFNQIGKTLTLRGTGSLTTNEIDAGDTVLWHVSAASGSGFCGTSLNVGQFGVSIVRGVDPAARKVKLADVITPVPDNTGIGNANRTVGQNFCVIQLVRIPSFQSFTLDATATGFQLKPIAFELGNGYGGIFSVQVNDTLSVLSGHNVDIEAGGAGFAGGAGVAGIGMPGDSFAGAAAAPSVSHNFTGGGGGNVGTPSGAGGGTGASNSGNGGAGGSESTSAGDPFGTCSPLSNCAMFGAGGGGGGAVSADGGIGGGIVLIFARKLATSSNFFIVADGKMGLGPDSGGGGGGTAYVRTIDGMSSNIFPTSNGGPGSTGSQGGGGGGGGLAKHVGCDNTPAFPAGSATGGAAGSGSGSPAATDGLGGESGNDLKSSGTFFCP